MKQREWFNNPCLLWVYILALIPFTHLLHANLPISLPTVLRDRIWIHNPVSIEVPNIISWPTLPYCSRWLQKGKPHCCGAGKGKLQEGM